MTPHSRPASPPLIQHRPGAVLILGLFLAVGVLPVAAQRFAEDPVEKFRQVLKFEQDKDRRYYRDLKGDALKYALNFRETELNKAARNLKTLPDLSRALLLFEWPDIRRSYEEKSLRPEDRKLREPDKSSYEDQARLIERKVHRGLAKKFIDSSAEVFRSASIPRKVAAAQLIAETVTKAGTLMSDIRELVYAALDPLVPLLIDLSKSADGRVQAAAAHALSQFHTKPKEVCPALEQLLRNGTPEGKIGAATGLDTLAQLVSDTIVLQQSVPGVTTQDTLLPRSATYTEDLVIMVTQVVNAAGPHLTQPSVAVRRRLTSAVHRSSRALAVPYSTLVGTDTYLREIPPKERPWTAEDAKQAQIVRENIRKDYEAVLPALRAFGDQASGLAAAVQDSDARTRLQARRAVGELARFREFLRRYQESVPREGAPKPAGNDDAEVKGSNRVKPPARLPVFRPVSRQEDKKADGEKKNDKKDEPRKDSEPPDPLGKMLDTVGDALVKGGECDPNPVTRRAAFEAIEMLGVRAERYVSQLAKALEDRDTFVRWIAARAIGQIAAGRNEKKLSPLAAEEVVPRLIRMLEDEDLSPRHAAFNALAEYGPAAESAVPALSKAVSQGDTELRIAAIKALEGIGEGAFSALPSVAKNLSEIDPRLRARAAELIGRFGPRARAYLTQLDRLASDPDPEVRRSATEATLRITQKD